MGGLIWNLRGKKRSFEDSILMTIFKGKVGNGVACCIAGDNDRKFANKRDVFLQDGARDMNFLPRFVRVRRGI